MRRLLDLFLMSLILILAVFWIGTAVQFPDRNHRVCRADWCSPGQVYVDAQAWIDQQVTGAGCVTEQDRTRIPSGIMAVATRDGEGTSWARRYTLDTAWSLAERGEARVVGFCY